MNNKLIENINQKPLVLIVDDIKENLEIIKYILEKEGYDIAICEKGPCAMEMAETLGPDLILLDIMMPGMNGFEVCENLKRSSKCKEIPVIFLTAKNDPNDILKGFDVGAVDYITKPFNSRELTARVKTHTELKRTRDVQKELIKHLEKSLGKIEQLSGLLPICSICKKIRDDKGYWQEVENFIEQHSFSSFAKAICPVCLKEHFNA